MATGKGVPEGRFVGMFYFLWHETGMARRSERLGGPYDVSKILRLEPGAASNPVSTLWGDIGVYHYWGEPLFGYYLSTDPWVLRRHALLLEDAGVDTLIFDATNALSYRDVYMALCEVLRKIRATGGRTPGIAFMVHTSAGETAEKIFQELYLPNLYSELWFRWEGKPLLLCDPSKASERVKEFFTLRRAHWPFDLTNTPYAWHWEAAYPQVYGYTTNQGFPEQVNVSVAQNLRREDAKVTNMSTGLARGRSFHRGEMERTAGAVNWGHNFQEQWDRAIQLGAPFVLVTSWNEWIAGRWGKKDGPLVFVDQFDEEYSRDIEPMRGGHGDNYYLQLVANIRRFKGAIPGPEASAPRSIRIARGFEQWEPVLPVYSDARDDIEPREFAGAAGLSYTNRSGRNDLVRMKASRDAENLYFYARTARDLAAPSGSNWMSLYIDADADPTTGWNGYDYVIGRAPPAGRDRLVVEQNAGGWSWRRVGTAQYRRAGCELHLAVSRRLLALPRGAGVNIDFKWADNLEGAGDPMEFYVYGDVAPESRFNFRYTAKQ